MFIVERYKNVYNVIKSTISMKEEKLKMYNF